MKKKRYRSSSGALKSFIIIFIIFIGTALLVHYVGKSGDSDGETTKSEQEGSKSSRFPYKTIKIYRVEDVPNVQLENSARFTSDPEGLIADSNRMTIDSIAGTIRDSLGVEVAVVVLPNFDGGVYATARDFATQLFNTWGMGNKETDQGLLIFLNLEEGNREISFETGYGLEAALPDAICKQIQVQVMLPYLKEAEYGEALEAGLVAVQKRLADPESEELLSTTASSDDEGDALLGFVIWTAIGLIFLGVNHFRRWSAVKIGKNAYQKYMFYEKISPLSQIGYYVFFPYLIIPYTLFFNIPWRRKLRRSVVCESCNSKGKMERVKIGKTVREATKELEGLRRYTFTCKNCGHQHFEDFAIPYIPPYISSGGSGYSSSSYDSSSSSSSSGGSWGGGSSGGGGASTRF